jgi:hypothetical protein
MRPNRLRRSVIVVALLALLVPLTAGAGDATVVPGRRAVATAPSCAPSIWRPGTAARWAGSDAAT